jgi:hypothetical protein
VTRTSVRRWAPDPESGVATRLDPEEREDCALPRGRLHDPRLPEFRRALVKDVAPGEAEVARARRRLIRAIRRSQQSSERQEAVTIGKVSDLARMLTDP